MDDLSPNQANRLSGAQGYWGTAFVLALIAHGLLFVLLFVPQFGIDGACRLRSPLHGNEELHKKKPVRLKRAQKPCPNNPERERQLQEAKRAEEQRKAEEARQAELRRQEEERRIEEQKRQEELKKQEEQKRLAEEKRKAEEKAEAERKAKQEELKNALFFLFLFLLFAVESFLDDVRILKQIGLTI